MQTPGVCNSQFSADLVTAFIQDKVSAEYDG